MSDAVLGSIILLTAAAVAIAASVYYSRRFNGLSPEEQEERTKRWSAGRGGGNSGGGCGGCGG
ncbi:hypothetical protein ACIA48_26730 [Mycobacterium sp. NPDC051804]|uniref:hypothetical protein n=1 Tax=Mycobacterium sp. NPDC051804 TaxID=3364295 RepID=UPI0037B4947F